MKKKLYIMGFLLTVMGHVYCMNFQNDVPKLSVAENVAASVIGVGTLLYGGWHGIMYGMQWSLSCNESSISPKIFDVLKNVVAPLATGITLMVTGFRATKK